MCVRAGIDSNRTVVQLFKKKKKRKKTVMTDSIYEATAFIIINWYKSGIITVMGPITIICYPF